MAAPGRPTGVPIFFTAHNGYWDRKVALYQEMSEGYPTGEYSVRGLSKEQLQEFTDWMIGLPPEIYVWFEAIHKPLERYLASEQRRY